MRRDAVWLADIVESAEAVGSYLGDVDQAGFLTSPLLRDAVLLRLTQVGEACARISDELKAAHPAVPWQKVMAFRNLAVHAYFSVDWQVVWHLATVRLPELEGQVSGILDSLDA
ncbi:MAG: DUF86 domain-containing protein [Candidatus Sericytochromatia bacterium]|nr:DUF86 domain-containing protein [Candidatus Sericytochromatia bacterium]